MLISSHRRALDHALVDALVAAAQQNDARAGGERARIALGEAAGRAGSGTPPAGSSATAATRRRRCPAAAPCPAPPPNGVSSTVRCRSCAKSRMLGASSDQTPLSNARPAATGRADRGTFPGTGSGRRRASSWRALRAMRLADDSVSAARPRRGRPAISTSGTQARVNGTISDAALAALDLQADAGAVVVHRPRPCRSPRRPASTRRQPDQVGEVELVLAQAAAAGRGR